MIRLTTRIWIGAAAVAVAGSLAHAQSLVELNGSMATNSAATSTSAPNAADMIGRVTGALKKSSSSGGGAGSWQSGSSGAKGGGWATASAAKSGGGSGWSAKGGGGAAAGWAKAGGGGKTGNGWAKGGASGPAVAKR